MEYILRISDSRNRAVSIKLDHKTASMPAADVIFDVLGRDASELVASGMVSPVEQENLLAVQNAIFDHDQQGAFIRDDVRILANGHELNPDSPLKSEFKQSGAELVCLAVVQSSAAGSDGAQAEMIELAQAMFIHHVGLDANIDVTTDHPEIDDLIKWGEAEGLIDIDVQKAAYKLTPKGQAYQKKLKTEAQDLIRRYDIFGDVDVDQNGKAHFDSGLGRDLRVAVFEFEGVNPYRARLLVGLNDSEWSSADWQDRVQDQNWYQSVFEQVDSAIHVDDVAEPELRRIIDQGRQILRDDPALQESLHANGDAPKDDKKRGFPFFKF